MRRKVTAQADHRQAVDNVEPFVGGSPRTVGERLRNAREDLGLELRQVSDILRIRYAHLRALEEGDVAALPGQTYAVGFVRTYADYLSLDSREMVERYKEEMSGIPRSNQLVFPTPKPEGKIPGGALVLVSLLLVGLAYGGWYAFNEYGDELNSLIMREAPPAQVAERAEPLAPAAPVTPSEPAPAADSAPTSEGAAPASDTTMAQTAPAEPAGAEPDSAVSDPAEPATTGSPAAEPPATAAVDETALVQAPEPAAPAEVPTAASGPAESEVSQTRETAAVPQVESSPASPSTVPAAPPSSEVVRPSTANPSVGAGTASMPASESAREVAPLREVLPTVQPGEAGPAPGASVAEAPADAAVRDLAPLPAAEPLPQAAREPEPQTTLAREETIPVPPIPQSADGGESGRAARVFGTANTDARIVLRATADSWVQVRNARSDLLFTQVLRAGDSYNVPNQDGLTLLTGNAGGLQVLVDGQPAPSLGSDGAVRRDIDLEPASLLGGAR